MAALCPGVQYGLSSQQNFGENKDLIFVKLTDSALRAIEEYIKNQNKFNNSPTIKFLGSENGELSFPSLHHAVGSTSFSFAMSSTADMEGQGGSFECIKQVGSPRGPLEGLGSIPYKIRIHANDDVYEVTRNRMTEAEDKYKNKCTREIKPNQTDIGRKVKLKQTRPAVLPIRREVSSMRPSIQPSYQSNVPSKPTPPVVHSSTNGLSNGLGSNHVSSSRPQLNSKKPSVPDIARRPLKERLIHLLALRPFKKFELHDRLTKEGLREKNSMTSVLKQISVLKDNCYHLNRPMWNEVHEDWPFYTESERQILKRRKPQNLTPPGGSDGGSSGSGQSPTSTHPGSPPPITSSKRPGFQDGPDGFLYKRQRIAHGAKPVDVPPYRQPIENNSQRRPVTDSRDASNMNPRSRESPTNGYFGSMNGYANGMLNDKRNISDDEDNASKKRSCDSHSLSFSVSREKTFLNNRSSSPANKIAAEEPRKEVSNERQNGPPNGMSSWMKLEEREKEREKERERNSKYNKVSSSTQNRISRVSPDSQTDSLPPADLEPPPVVKKEEKAEFPDYKQQYVTIQDVDQRRRYKADFNADYAEYRDLHGIVEKVSRRFAQLEERLKQEDENSPRYKDIKRQIVREYHENKKDLEHQRAKRRFQYLHDKLSHIKQLVLEYDEGMRDSQY
ncbi:RNA polymerase II elongation factor Ell [Anoplophora glabripennis]|uniref:RNA polymerase II elongation factor Ell n=1 Tax=Anoplophora glabripennis TaxID=217634 RepID=UPI000874518D|nr:RNA polymerase II elongation factor Ell [Anoplophora glabripennis]